MSPSPPQGESRFVNSMSCAYMVSVVAAWHAEIWTYPLDLAKTRLQIQGEMAKKSETPSSNVPHRGLFKTAAGIVTEEGLFSLWTGISAVFWRHVFYSGARVILYKAIKEDVFHNYKGDVFPPWQSAVCGVSAGVIAQFIASPADLLKVQIQMEGRRRLMGLPPRVLGLVDAFQKTMATGGIRMFWNGAVPNMQRAALVNLGDLSAYDVAKRYIIMKTGWKEGPVVQFIASCCAGFVAACMGTPADVIKTRVMNQPVDERGRGLLYSSTTNCFKKTVTNEGVMALYKGFLPMWMRLAPWALIFWLSYEQIMRGLGAEQF